MRRLLLVLLFTTVYFGAQSSHIVGGEFELLHLFGPRYRLTLILYFDSINGAPGARDPSAVVQIFRKSDNAVMSVTIDNVLLDYIELPFKADSSVSYTNNECRVGELVTNKLFYTRVIELSSGAFTDPQGYYIAWERCCRNYTIDNIYSDDPQLLNGIYAGQTFYLEFPPLIKNGLPFVNSSPRLFPPLSDYACPRIPFFVDFSGTDDDGDSLVYSIVAPYNTKSPDPVPPIVPGFPVSVPRPGPYQDVNWRPGYGLGNILNGLTNLQITYDGILSVTPESQGLFVFAVRCEEFRDGEKIGEVRRDFQMLVLNRCPVPIAPVVVGRELGAPDFGTTGALEVHFDGTESDSERSFEIKVSDLSSFLPDDNFREKITRLKAIALDFYDPKNKVRDVLPVVTWATLNNGSQAEAIFKISLPACPYTKTGFYKIGIVAFDDACAVPITDTIVVNVHHPPPPDSKPVFTNEEEIAETITEGNDEIKDWQLGVTDAENDLIFYRLVPVDFKLEDIGMSFTGAFMGQANPVNKTLSWDPKCDVYDFTKKSSFELYFIAEDLDACAITHADTTHLQLSVVDFEQTTPPIIDNSVLTNAESIELNIEMYGDPLTFDVTGFDVDPTFILLRVEGVGFDPAAYGVKFPQDFGQQNVASQFNWELTCDTIDINIERPFEFRFVVIDSLNKCKFYKADTLQVLVSVEAPERKKFIPPNVFTPNGDEKNKFFAMVKHDEATDEFINILPDDNCFGRFVSITIYDRWGKQVYESFDRDFRWYGEGAPVGVYFYSLKFSDRDYKGIVSLRL